MADLPKSSRLTGGHSALMRRVGTQLHGSAIQGGWSPTRKPSFDPIRDRQ